MTNPRPSGWYAIARGDEVRAGKLFSLRRFGEDLILFRDERGKLAALEDRCPHRSVRLRKGKLTPAGCVQCPYHGFEFNRDGDCVHVPASPEAPIPQTLKARAPAVYEQQGIVYLWHGDAARRAGAPLPPEIDEYGSESRFTHAWWKERWETRMERAVENQLDMAHLPFVHRTTIGGSLPKAIVAEADPLVRDDRVVGLHAGTGGRRLLELYYPNVWINIIGKHARVTAFFAPVDDESCDVYLSFAHRFLDPGVLARLLAWAGAKFSTRITAQDRPVVEDHIEDDPRREALVQLDVPIAMYRKWQRASLEDERDDDGGEVVHLNPSASTRT